MEKNDTLSPDLERRKQIRLRVRDDLTITPQKYEGRTYYVVKDPVSLRYYRFKEQEHFLFKMLNGKHTLDETQKEFEQRFRPNRLTLEDLEQFGQQLLTAGLAQNEAPNAGKQLFERRGKRRRSEIAQKFTNILYIKIPIFDPERILIRMLRYTRWIFSIWFLLLSVGIMLGALFLVASHFQTFRDKMPSYYEFFTLKTMIYMWAALGVVKVIHEFGHGLSCKAFGGEVHEMGFLFLCLSPCMYCNVSDAWMLPSKWKRIIISGAGIYVELMIAAIATYVWWNTPHSPFINNMALSLMVVCSVSTIVFNGNPLMRFDGYYVMSDLLEIPNLRERSNRYIKRLAMEHCLGIEMMPEPYMALGRRILFVTYAVCSYLYRWLITFVILKFLATFLKPYKLEILSTLLATAAIASMFGWPLVRLIKGVKKRGRLPDMKPIRVTISASIVAALLLVFFFLPLPVSQVRETGLVQIDPNHFALVRVETTGILTDIHVKEGQLVKGGITPLATFTSLELSAAEDQARTTYNVKNQFVQQYLAIWNDPRTNERDKNRIKLQMVEAESARDEAQEQLNVILAKAKARLVLKAPRDGIVFNVPTDDEIGKHWEEGKEAIFCKIGDPNQLRVLIPVGPSDYDVIRRNERNQQAEDKTLPVTIRPTGADDRTYKGRISFLPSEEAQTVPLPLASKFGGPLATRPVSTDEKGQQRLLPQAQVYLMGVQFDELDGTIQPGTLAQVKIRCEYRSCAWWVWRKLAGAFDLGLW